MPESLRLQRGFAEDEILLAASAVWKAYLAWGPVDDGTQQGKNFEKALDRLMCAEVALKAHRLVLRKAVRKKKEKKNA